MNQQDAHFLPFFLREPIYVVTEPEPVPREAPLPHLAYQGQGKQQVLILVRETNYPFLAPDDQTFLTRVLSAISLSADDVLVVNWEEASPLLQKGILLDTLLPELLFRTCLVLGEMPAPWSLSDQFEEYQVTTKDNKQLLHVDSLTTLANQVEKKAQFWKCLQKIFGLT